MSYGSLELTYAQPFAESLIGDPAFRAWVLRRTTFAAFADEASLLHDEMRMRRAKGAATWWRSHFTETCRCRGCSGQETDLLAIFENRAGFRFAVHFEIKQPKDRFPSDRDQAANYATRAECWVRSAPKAVLPHSAAATVLLCSASKLPEYGPQASKFGTVITFEDIAAAYPHATKAT